MEIIIDESKSCDIIQYCLTKAFLMKPPKPVRWMYMIVIGVNLKIKYV